MKTNREGYIVGEDTRECTSCGTIFQISSKSMTICKVCNCVRVKAKSPEEKMYRRAKARATSSGIEFSIDLSDIKIPEVCPILGIKLEPTAGKSGGFRASPSLDRMDNLKGYTKDNIMVVSNLANAMKRDASKAELRKFAEWVLRNTDED